jgi:hypothetical protein
MRDSEAVEYRNCYRSVRPESHHHCLTRIEPTEVVPAVRALLNGTRPAAGRGPSEGGRP